MLVIRGGTFLTPERRIENGVLLIQEGKIVKIEKSIPIPTDAEIIDCHGKFVIPGMIDAHCHTGIFQDGIGMWETCDGCEMTDPVTPHLRAIDAIHPGDMAFKDVMEAGVTTINTSPGSKNVINGQTAAIKTYGQRVEDMVVLAPSAMKLALGENPKRTYGDQKKMPSTRMGIAGILREWLTKAKDYLEEQENYQRRSSEYVVDKGGLKGSVPPRVDLRLQELGRVLKKEMPVHIHVHRADDILTALRIGEEFGLKVVLIHATEGYKVADVLAERCVPCAVGPIFWSRVKYELRGMTPQNPGILSRAGVKVALQTDEMSSVRYITLNAALAVKEGMDEEEALKAITIYPAEILGIQDRVGSLEPGKDADVVVLSAHPFDITKSHVELVLIGGQITYKRTYCE